MRLEINVHDDRKIVEIWLSHSEQADAALREQLRPIYQEYNGKKYTVAVFQSGTEDLYEQTHQLLLYNRNRAAELEAKAGTGDEIKSASGIGTDRYRLVKPMKRDAICGCFYKKTVIQYYLQSEINRQNNLDRKAVCL